MVKKSTPIRNKNLIGFTLIELLVVTAIISIFSVIMLANYRGGQKQLALQRDSHKLARNIKRAQEMAMSTREFQWDPAPAPPKVPDGGYGVYLHQGNDFYVLYADDGNERYSGGDKQVGDKIYFEKGIYISSLSPASASINFKPPDPAIKLKDSAGTEKDKVVIKIALKTNPSKNITITINKAGLIEIQ